MCNCHLIYGLPPNSPVYNPRSLITIKHPKWPTVVLRVCVCLFLCMYMNIAGLPAKCKEASGRDSNHTTNPTCLMVYETTTVWGKANVVKRQRSQRKFICGKCLRLVVYTIQKCIINMEVTRGVLSICKLTRVITFEYRTDRTDGCCDFFQITILHVIRCLSTIIHLLAMVTGVKRLSGGNSFNCIKMVTVIPGSKKGTPEEERNRRD